MAKGSRTRWDAFGMPWIAEALALSERHYQERIDATDTIEAGFKEHPSRPYMKLFADKIADADLLWMSRTAASVAADLAANDMPEITFQELIHTSDLPPVGLMLWPKPLATFDWRNVDMQDAGEPTMKVTWDGIAWIYDQTHFTSYLVSQMSEQRKRGLLSDMRPSFAPGKVIRFYRDKLTEDGHQDSGSLDLVSPLDDPEQHKSVPPTLGATIQSLFALIGQQRVVTQKRLTTEPSKKSTRTARNTVTILDMLRPPAASGVAGNPDTNDQAHRAYRRWFVRGHYKRQPYGPGNTLRKVIYVSLHTAGHPEAPDPTGPPPPRVAGVYGKKFRGRERHGDTL